MKHGPAVSLIFNLIREEPAPGEESVLREHIRPEGWDVVLAKPMDDDELSAAEAKLLRQIFALYGHKNRWDLVEYCHTLPEWKDPGGSSLPIEPADILRGEGRPESEVAEVTSELENLALVHHH